MKDSTFDLRDLAAVIGRNFWVIFLTVAVCTAAAGAAAYYLPKKFKSSAVISLQAGYFQNPLVKDLISEVFDQGELNAQRSALLKFALNNTFLDELGEKYGLFQTEPMDPLRDAATRYESTSRFTASTRGADGSRVVAVFERQGLRWRLVDIRHEAAGDPLVR